MHLEFTGTSVSNGVFDICFSSITALLAIKFVLKWLVLKLLPRSIPKSTVHSKDCRYHKDSQLSDLCTLKTGINFLEKNENSYLLEKSGFNENYHRNFGTNHKYFYL